jgi:hypothetical protein
MDRTVSLNYMAICPTLELVPKGYQNLSGLSGIFAELAFWRSPAGREKPSRKAMVVLGRR